MTAKRGTLFTGTSNIVLPVTKKDFPVAFRSASRLNYYSSLFNSLEVNSTFYKLPLPGTFEKWANDVPDDFRFTIKLWQEITHRKKLAYSPADIRIFMQAASRTGKKKGCLLVQFPASITTDYTRTVAEILEQLVELNTAPRWQICIEFRHNSWYDATTTKMLVITGVSLVGHDMPKSKTAPHDSSPTMYLRFHGPTGDYRGGYTPETLQIHAHQIDTWLSRGKDVYVYFNNTLGDAFNNAQYLQAIAGAPGDENLKAFRTHAHFY